MLPIIGVVIVFGSIIVGYLMHHGNLAVLVQPNEFVIIGGAALGALVIASPASVLSRIFKAVPSILSGHRQDKKAYLELLSLLYTIFMTVKKDGLLAIEKDIEKPENSPIFKKYPEILKNHHAINFICDNLKVFVVGVSPMDLEEMMQLEMDAHHEESSLAPSSITKTGDALPGFGIVAAVLGVVITMGKMSEPPEVIGNSVAAALVGTFLGILLCYGLVGPIGTLLEHKARDESKYLDAIRVSILAFAKDFPPQVAVEAGRRVLFSDVKPSFSELEESIRKKK